MKISVLVPPMIRLAVLAAGVLAATPAFGQLPPQRPSAPSSTPRPMPEPGRSDVAAGTPASPGAADAVTEAGQRFQRGLELYHDGDHSLALIEFERAYALVANYKVLYNIGQVSIQLNRYAHARKALEKYLALGGAEIGEQRRVEVAADLEMLSRRTAFISVATTESGAEILVDEILVGESPLTEPLLLDAGEHKLTVRKPGYRARPLQFTLAGGDAPRLNVPLTKEEVKPTLVVERRVESPVVQDTGRSRRTLLVAGWTGTGVLAVGAVLTGVLGAAAASDLHDSLGSATSREKLDDKQANARTLLAVGDGLTLGAVILGGISLYATLRHPARGAGDHLRTQKTTATVRDPAARGLGRVLLGNGERQEAPVSRASRPSGHPRVSVQVGPSSLSLIGQF